MTASCVRGRARLSPLAFLAAIPLVLAAASPSFATETIAVSLDQARLIKLPERAATVVLGDPLIADVSLQPGHLAVITAKGYGATNFVVLDADGAVLMEKSLEVRGPVDPTVFVYRGIDRFTYSCTPDCSRRINLGDEKDNFGDTLGQTTALNSAAVAVGSPTSGANKANIAATAASRGAAAPSMPGNEYAH